MRVTALILSFLISFSSFSQSDVVSVQEKNNQVSTSNATIDFCNASLCCADPYAFISA